MNVNIITEAPWWYLLFCLLTAFTYSLILYRKDTRFSDLRPVWIRLMAAFRFFSVFILCLLLMSPLIKTTRREVEKPLMIVLQDESSSVVSVKDSIAFKESYQAKLNSLISDLSEQFDVRTYSLGQSLRDKITFDFEDSETDLSTPVSDLKSRYAGRNLGAVIIASDGLYNKGSNPMYAYAELKAPVYTIGLGDTTIFRDLMIKGVNHNKTAFLGNTFPVEITLDARKCAGETVKLTISKKSKTILTRDIQISSDRFNNVIPVYLEADEKGANQYSISITELGQELTYDNNRWNFYIDVIDNKQVILCLSNSPHPDLGTLRNVLESNPGYEFRAFNLNEFDGNLSDVNLVIMHQIPSVSNQATAIIEKLNTQEIPVWYILGSQSNVTAFNGLGTGVTITENRGNQTEILAHPNNDFSLFTFDEEFFRRTGSFPPLIAPFGNYSKAANVQVLLNQKVGPVKTEMPLMYFFVQGDRKTAVLTGEGLWKWRLTEFSENGNTDASSALITKTVQYLSIRDIKTPFRLYYKRSFAENEPVMMDAELYNESGELINTADVQISITNSEGSSFPFTFSRTDRAYSLNAGYLPAGIYNFKASAKTTEKTHSTEGTFTVTELQAERAETVADHGMLQALSARTGGEFFTQETMNVMAGNIKNRDDIRSVSYLRKQLDDVINLKWIFGLIMLLLSAEWFLRKRSGAY